MIFFFFLFAPCLYGSLSSVEKKEDILENRLSDFVSFKDNSHLICVMQKKDLSFKISFMLTYYIFLCYYIAVILLFLIQS